MGQCLLPSSWYRVVVRCVTAGRSLRCNGVPWAGTKELVHFVDICAPEAEQLTSQAANGYHTIVGRITATGKRYGDASAQNAARSCSTELSVLGEGVRVLKVARSTSGGSLVMRENSVGE